MLIFDIETNKNTMETSIKVGNKTLAIVQDNDQENPRTAFDGHIGKMIFTGNYQHLGDSHEVPFGGYSSREDFIERGPAAIRKVYKDVMVILPVHLYSHSGESISTNSGYPYDCRWDSGTIGFVIVTKSSIREQMGIKRVGKEWEQKAIEIAEGEVKELNQWLTGDVYGYIITDEDDEEVDSCYGFYGDDWKTNGIGDHVPDEFIEALELA